MSPLFGRSPRRDEVAIECPPVEPSAAERHIDPARLIRLFDQWTRAAHQCGAKELADMIQDERIELSRRRVPVVPGRAS